MLSSAAKLALVVLSAGQVGGLSTKEAAAYEHIRQSTAMLFGTNGFPCGTAALIDKHGLFVAPTGLVPGTGIRAQLPDGRTLHLALKGRDGCSGLALLQAISWSEDDSQSIATPAADIPPGAPLFAILPEGPLRAEYVTGNLYGLQRNGLRRLVPMCEIRFETPILSIGGALVFTQRGEFLGPLSAAQPISDAQRLLLNNQAQNLYGGQGTVPGGGGGAAGPGGFGGVPGGGFGGGRGGAAGAFPAPNTSLLNNSAKFGPAPLTVGYTAGVDVIRRALEGFRSPGHVVSHAVLGVYCIQTPGGGSLVQRVVASSPAAKAGIKVDDIIDAIGADLIRDQVDFGKAMFRMQAGDKVTLRIRRGGLVMLKDVVMGAAKD